MLTASTLKHYTPASFDTTSTTRQKLPHRWFNWWVSVFMSRWFRRVWHDTSRTSRQACYIYWWRVAWRQWLIQLTVWQCRRLLWFVFSLCSFWIFFIVTIIHLWTIDYLLLPSYMLAVWGNHYLFHSTYLLCSSLLQLVTLSSLLLYKTSKSTNQPIKLLSPSTVVSSTFIAVSARMQCSTSSSDKSSHSASGLTSLASKTLTFPLLLLLEFN